MIVHARLKLEVSFQSDFALLKTRQWIQAFALETEALELWPACVLWEYICTAAYVHSNITGGGGALQYW